MEEMFIILGAGAAGGFVRSLIGFGGQSDRGEEFKMGKSLKSIVRSAIGGAAFSYALGLEPVSAFFAGAFSDVSWHELFKYFSKR